MGYLSKRWLCYAKAGRWGYQIKGKQASEGAYQPQISLSLLLRTQAAHTKLAFRFAEAGVSRERERHETCKSEDFVTNAILQSVSSSSSKPVWSSSSFQMIARICARTRSGCGCA